MDVSKCFSTGCLELFKAVRYLSFQYYVHRIFLYYINLISRVKGITCTCNLADKTTYSTTHMNFFEKLEFTFGYIYAHFVISSFEQTF